MLQFPSVMLEDGLVFAVCVCVGCVCVPISLFMSVSCDVMSGYMCDVDVM